MRIGQSIRRAGLCLGWAGALLTGLAAQASMTLTPHYPANAHLFYALTIHSAIGSRATLDTKAEVEEHILPGATPGHFEAELRFTQFQTTVKATSPDDEKALSDQAAATAHAALSMQPPRFQVTPEAFTVESRSPGGDYDQPVEMLAELVRTDDLPTGPVHVGSRWTRQRDQPIPTMNASVKLTMDCSLTALGGANGQSTATIAVHSDGNTQLPPNALPDSAALAAQGLVPEAHVSFSTDSTAVYRVADAILQQTTSETHNAMEIRFVGPSPNAQTTTTNIDSNATVKLERMSGGS